MPHHAAKDRVEEALDASGLAWRVLQPCAYADNLDGAARRASPPPGRFRSPWGLTHGAVAGRPARRRGGRRGAAHRGRSGRRHLRGGRARAADRPADRRAARRLAGPGGARGRRRARTGRCRSRVRRPVPPADVRPLPGARVHRQPAGAGGAAGPAAAHLRRAPAPIQELPAADRRTTRERRGGRGRPDPGAVGPGATRPGLLADGHHRPDHPAAARGVPRPARHLLPATASTRRPSTSSRRCGGRASPTSSRRPR